MKTPAIGLILLLALVPCALTISGQSYTLAPAPFQYVLSTAGTIIPNGCIWTYAAGTTTAIATYADTAGTPNGNPIVADNYGRFSAYLLPGTNYKFQYETTPCAAPSTHGTILKVQDNIQGTPAASANVDIVGTAGTTLTAGQCAFLSDGSGGNSAGQWYKCDPANAYSSTLVEVGIPIANIVSATQGTIRIAGYITGLSSLTPGAQYYAGSSGALTSTAPAIARAVGSADTSTSLIMAANPPPTAKNLYTNTISFPAVQVPSSDVNTLDDYEEGTWTPVLGGSGGTSGQTYAAQSGYYIKIGKFVWATCVISLSTKGTITATAQVQGFPFTSENSSNNSAAGIITNFSNLATNWSSLTLVIQANSTAANIQGVSAASTGQTNLATGDIANNTNLTATIMYRATQ